MVFIDSCKDSIDDRIQFLNHLVSHLLYLIDQRLKTSDTTHADRNRCYSHVNEGSHSTHMHNNFMAMNLCASWGKQLALRTITVMMELVINLIQGSLPVYKVDVSLFTPIEITGLYTGPCFPLRQICIQLSGRVWGEFRRSLGRSRECIISTHVSAAKFHRAVRIMCVPPQEGHNFSPPRSIISEKTRYKDVQFVSLHPSATLSDKALSLLRYEIQGPEWVDFGMVPDTQKKREDVCEMLIREIESGEQGLDEDERLIASNCVRAGFLGPEID